MIHTLINSGRKFLRGTLGQDLSEYCLITALLSIVALVLFYNVSGGMQGMWGFANTTIAGAATAGGGAGSTGGGQTDATASTPTGGDQGSGH